MTLFAHTINWWANWSKITKMLQTRTSTRNITRVCITTVHWPKLFFQQMLRKIKTMIFVIQPSHHSVSFIKYFWIEF